MIPDLTTSKSVAITTEDDNRERERMHRQMLSAVSHDLKTPLASMIGSLEIIERMQHKLSEEQQAALIQVALQEAYRLDAFITNILDMAKLDSGALRVKREDTEIGALLRNCLLRLDHRMRGTSINIDTLAKLEVNTDPTLLGQVICLVLDNAVKYGGKPPNIHIKFEKAGEAEALIHIHDNGPGIPVTQVDAIFSKYTRFTKGDQQNAGTGLGLAISRSTMTLLGGDITAANHPEGGAVFTLRLPL